MCQNHCLEKSEPNDDYGGLGRPLTEDGTRYPERSLENLGFQKYRFFDFEYKFLIISCTTILVILVVTFQFSLTKCVFVGMKEKWRREFEKSAVRLTSTKPGNCLYQKTHTPSATCNLWWTDLYH